MPLSLDFGTFSVTLTRRPVRTLRLRVRPDGSVHVSAPARAPEAAIRAWVLEKQAWIVHHQAAFQGRPQPVARQYVSGELHYVLGRAYPLRVTERPGRAQVTLAAGELHLALPAGHDAASRARAVQQWYRARLQAQVPALLAKWEPVVGAQVAAWGLKAMRTRWGTCNVRARRIGSAWSWPSGRWPAWSTCWCTS